MIGTAAGILDARFGAPPSPTCRYLSPGNSIFALGLHNFCSEPLKSVGARMVLRLGKPEKVIDFTRISEALSLSGFVNSQWRSSSVDDAR